MERKQLTSLVKSIGEQGLVTSVVAVFGNVDFQNDRIMHGAFTNSISKWKARMGKGKFLPVVYGHQDNPESILGKVVDMRETADGLEVDEQYFLDKPKARASFDAMREGVLGGSSFAYDIIRAKRASDGVQDLIELDVIEVGPTVYPANDQTRLVGVKDAERAEATLTVRTHPLVVAKDAEIILRNEQPLVETASTAEAFTMTFQTKAGRVLSAKNETQLRQARDLIDGVLAALGEKDTADAGGKTEEPEGAKADDPSETPVLASARALFATG